jgi:uncharacterized protein YndB with AHSA1/START domain
MNTLDRQAVTHSTFVIERQYPVAPERVFAALAEPNLKRVWFAGGDASDFEEFEMDFRVGGNERTVRRFKADSPFPGVALVNRTIYQDIVVNRRVVIAYTMSFGDKRISASLATFELLATEKGTQLVFTEQVAFFEGADGPQMREQGWRKLLESLATELTRQ